MKLKIYWNLCGQYDGNKGYTSVAMVRYAEVKYV